MPDICLCVSGQPTETLLMYSMSAWITVYACAYTGIAVAVSHDEVEGGTGMGPVLIHRAAAVLKYLLAKVCTLFCLLLKQQVPKLHTNTHRQMKPGTKGVYTEKDIFTYIFLVFHTAHTKHLKSTLTTSALSVLKV